ncbi:MAG: gamma-glutamyltransferase [Nitrosopumilaceae archaeon]|nr:gamma-glutamyltransferase [Nitrosopumilaceae archaeon]
MDIEQIESSFRTSGSEKAAYAAKGMVASAFPGATGAGIEMLRKGGNAVDAACATAFALGVCEPQASGIGGQSMCIMHINGKSIAVDGSSRAPSLAHSSIYAESKNGRLGYKAATVPSTVAVLGTLHERYGRLEWQKILAPAIRIAKRGYRITRLQHSLQKKELDGFLGVDSGSGARYFLKDGRVPYEAGDRLVQDDLAHTLAAISENGYQSFYHGGIAKQIDADMRANGGLIREEDLAFVPEPIERVPIMRKYRGVSVVAMPPPAAGSTLLLTLMMLNHLPSKFLHGDRPSSYHFMAEAFRKAFLHRVRRPFNPHTYDQMQSRHHLQRTFARQMADSIHNAMDATLPMIDPIFGGEEDTTHLSVMDGEGNAVGITQSIELAYGSKAAAGELGFLYNNYISAFEFSTPSNPFYIRPNGIPWTSVSPALIFHDGQLWMVVGSPGSQRIFSTVTQFLTGMIDGDMPMDRSMDRPRFHCTIGGTISVEEGGFDGTVRQYLEEIGYKVTDRERFSFYHGAIHAAMRLQTRAGFQGVAEVRRDGTAGGID